MNSSGLPAPLGTIKRKPKQETTGLIPDDGFVSIQILSQVVTDILPLERTENDQSTGHSKPKGACAQREARPAHDQQVQHCRTFSC